MQENKKNKIVDETIYSDNDLNLGKTNNNLSLTQDSDGIEEVTQSLHFEPKKHNNLSAHQKIMIRKRTETHHPLRDLRVRRGLTLEQLSKLTQLSPSYLSRLENSGRRLNTDILKPLARVLACHPGDLLPQETYESYQASESKAENVLPTTVSHYARDLPLYYMHCKDTSETCELQMTEPSEWIIRPLEMYGIQDCFAFKMKNKNIHSSFRENDWIFVHTKRALTIDCNILVVMNTNQAYIGQFKGWIIENMQSTETMAITIQFYKDNNYTNKRIALERQHIKLFSRIIGSMEPC